MSKIKKISIVWGILMVLIFGLLTFLGLKWKEKNQPYFDLEESMITKTQQYFEQYYSYPEGSKQVKITLDELKSYNIIQELSTNDEQCTGYVIVKNEGVMKYNAYIKCQNYQTKGYQE